MGREGLHLVGRLSKEFSAILIGIEILMAVKCQLNALSPKLLGEICNLILNYVLYVILLLFILTDAVYVTF